MMTDDGESTSLTAGIYIPPGTIIKIDNDAAEIAALVDPSTA